MNNDFWNTVQEENSISSMLESAGLNTVKPSDNSSPVQEALRSTKKEAKALRAEVNSYSLAAVLGMILLLALYLLQVYLGRGGNYGMCAVLFGTLAVQKITVSVRLGRLRDVIISIIYLLAFATVLTFHILWLSGRVA